MKRIAPILLLIIVASILIACGASSPEQPAATPAAVTVRIITVVSTVTPAPTRTPTPDLPAEEMPDVGCAGADYPDWRTSPYVLPFPVGLTYPVQLSQCSGSYHSLGLPDAFATDFVMDIGTPITAARAGTVAFVTEAGKGRGENNYIVIDHGDNTYAIYMHLKFEGALAEVGDVVEQGQEIGLSGVTGLAGYPHLHFIVVQDDWDWPYTGIPVNFSNTVPNPRGLAENTEYTALPYER